VVDVEAQHTNYFPFEPVVSSQLTKELGRESYQLLLCAACGLVFASPMVAPSSAWYEIAYRALDVKPEHRWEYDAVLDQLTHDDSVYEIGCGTGAFLHSCAQRRIAASGIDFWPDAVRTCRAAGLDATLGQISMERAVPLAKPASVIVSFHVLEHLAHPTEFFRHASRVSQERASLWISVPSNLRASRVLGFSDSMDDPPHHLTKWTEAAFAAIGRRNGWRLVDVRFEPFSVRSGLWTVASHYGIYEKLRQRGWLQSPIAEKSLRAVLYPAAALQLFTNSERHRMSGLSMLARYERDRGNRS
jgi:SAM-dependent methyltransferase